MNAPQDPPRSKGMTMIAAYRAERLNQRPQLRASLRQSHNALRHSRDGAARPDEPAGEPAAEAPAAPPGSNAAPDPTVYASVFANLVNLEVAERLNEAAHAEAAQAEAVQAEPAAPAAPEPAPAPVQPEAAQPEAVQTETPEPVAQPAPEPAPPFDPPLAEIGFGPGMLIRLSQLGVHTTAELARADAAHLRAELGDISRLVDVETWIEAARQRAKTRS